MEYVLADNIVVKYLLKNESIISKYFNVPAGLDPKTYLLNLANFGSGNRNKSSEYEYRISPIHCSFLSACSFCHGSLVVKKTVNASLYDDVFGTLQVAIISKYCKSCKLTFYPGYAENYETRTHIYENDWRKYGIFLSTSTTCFSEDFIERSVGLKLKCHTTFSGRSDAYNYQHKYHKDNPNKMDKRIHSDGYYKYTLICFKERYNMELKINMDVSVTLNNELPQLLDQFMMRASHHQCAVAGCMNCIVIDGHMKAHRKICCKKGCVEDPKLKSKFCEDHCDKFNEDVRDTVDNVQILKNEKEFHIEKILKTFTRYKRRHYEVKWLNYDETSIEPKENIPRVLTELFDLYGDSSIPTTIKDRFEESGVKYVVLEVENQDDLILPACSLQLDENAYYIPSPKLQNKCNTEKTKSRFYHRTGGILAMGRPCGYIIGLAEIYGGESIHQVADMIESFIDSSNDPSSTESVLYDDGCHLRRSVEKKPSIYPHLANTAIKIDRFHFKNHVDAWCRANMNPDDSVLLKNVNTEIMEQVFAWLKGYAPSLRYMKRVNYLFLLIDMIDRHNMENMRK